jgi:hypothetical protein
VAGIAELTNWKVPLWVGFRANRGISNRISRLGVAPVSLAAIAMNAPRLIQCAAVHPSRIHFCSLSTFLPGFGIPRMLSLSHLRIARPLAVAAASVLAVTSLSQARDLVVDNVNGNDAQNDRGKVPGPASFGPYRTIERALLGASPGDRIILTNTGEPYRECIALMGPQHSGSPGAPFEIVGNGATLDGTLAPLPQNWREVGRGIWQLHPSPPGYGLLIQDGNVLPEQVIDGVDLTELRPLHWTRSGANIFFRTEENRGPFDYPLDVTSLSTGITLYDVEHVTIRDLTVRGYRLDGINVHSRSREIAILDVTTRHNGRAGLTIAGDCQARIGASLSEANGSAQLRVEGRGVARLGNVKLGEGIGAATVVVDAGRVEQLPRP